MTWTNREINEKIDRIYELKAEGLNTPRMFYLPKMADPPILEEAFEWAAKINYKDPSQIFNIRTYNYSKEVETSQTKHICDISHSNLEAIVLDVNLGFTCMIDAETPDNGRLAGNILLDDVVSPTGRVISTNFTIDFCEKEIRAMVRDHDKHIYGSIVGQLSLDLENEPIILKKVIEKANKFKHDVILEWTWFCDPAGERGENLVFWEYRKV